MQPFSIVVAVDDQLGIGKTGALPWRLKEDMKHFRELTMGTGNNAVIMGRKTWESIPEKFRPLPGRINVVLSKTTPAYPGATVFRSLDDALLNFYALNDQLPGGCERVFVIGGGQIYNEAVAHPACAELWITKVGASFDCDVTFPRYEDRFRLDSVTGRFADGGIECAIERWVQR